MAKISIASVTLEGEEVVFVVEAHDPSVIEHPGEFRLRRVVAPRDRRAINDTDTIFRCPVTWSGNRFEVRVPLSQHQVYSYAGASLDIHLLVEVYINDAVIFDTKISESYVLPVANKPRVSENPNHLVDPHDFKSFFDNLKSVPTDAKLKIALAIAAIFFFAGLCLVTLVLMFAWPAFRRLLTPDFLSLVIFGSAGAFFVSIFVGWAVYKKQMKAYLQLDGTTTNFRLAPGDVVQLADLISGKTQIALDQLRFRVVAANMECGQYTRGSGTTRRTISFREPVRGVLLYDATFRDIPAGQDLKALTAGEMIHFDRMFEVLYPPNMVSSSHGIDILWEIQILHPKFADYEIIGSGRSLDYRHFLIDNVEEYQASGQQLW